jgi:hypothetical protein
VATVKSCPECGLRFTSRKATAVYCGSTCRKRAERARKAVEARTAAAPNATVTAPTGRVLDRSSVRLSGAVDPGTVEFPRPTTQRPSTALRKRALAGIKPIPANANWHGFDAATRKARQAESPPS